MGYHVPHAIDYFRYPLQRIKTKVNIKYPKKAVDNNHLFSLNFVAFSK